MPVADTGVYLIIIWWTLGYISGNIMGLEFEVHTKNSMSSSQWNELGKIYVKWDIKTQTLRYVSARSVARNSNCPNSTLCNVHLEYQKIHFWSHLMLSCPFLIFDLFAFSQYIFICESKLFENTE